MSLSLNGSLRTCRVDQGSASRIQSDRFENPGLMVCPVWTGFDSANRAVALDSYYTKSAGCNSPLDRVDVENSLRPQYMEYINLDAEGFRQNGDIYSSPSDKSLESCRDANKSLECYGSAVRTAGLKQLPTITGNFGMAPGGGQIIPSAEKYPYSRAMNQN